MNRNAADKKKKEEDFARLCDIAAKHQRKIRLGVSRMKKRNTTTGTLQNPRPYKVWREHFIECRRCERQHLAREVIVSAIPHVLLNLLLIAYLLFGAFSLPLADSSLDKGNWLESLYFSFHTIATIGYGADYPTTDAGKVAVLAYCVVGIPLIFLVLSNDGHFIVDAYWIFRNSYMRGTEEWDGEMPLRVTFYLLATHCLLGGFLFSYWVDSLPFFQAIYYSFISISTIGFGDIVVTPKDAVQTIVVLLYLSIGIIYLSTLTGSLSVMLKKLHYLGRQFSGVSDVDVWFGGQALSVRELITMVAEQFETSPELLHTVLNDLDNILAVAYNNDTEEAISVFQQHQEYVKQNSFIQMEESPVKRKLTVVRGTSDSSDSSRQSTPLFKMDSTSSLFRELEKDSSKSLHALGVVYHTIQKRDSVRRSLSFRRQRPAAPRARKASLHIPAYPTTV